jgi:hypothetical protein
MKTNILKITLAAIGLTMLITIVITVLVFNSSFAHKTIDYFSFAAALFLIIDGIYKISHYRIEKYFPNHFIRHLRIIVGVCIFTIHAMQYVYGV